MKYTKEQVQKVSAEMRRRYMSGEAEGYELVVALVAMVRAGRIDVKDFKSIILDMHLGNPMGAVRTIEKAKPFVDPESIESILKEVVH